MMNSLVVEAGGLGNSTAVRTADLVVVRTMIYTPDVDAVAPDCVYRSFLLRPRDSGRTSEDGGAQLVAMSCKDKRPESGSKAFWILLYAKLGYAKLNMV